MKCFIISQGENHCTWNDVNWYC